MSDLAASLLFGLALVAGLLVAIRLHRADAQCRMRMQRQVDGAFIAAANGRLPQEPRYRPELLKLVRNVDEFSTSSDGGTTGLQSTRLYRVSPDAYVLFICTAGQAGYIKLLSRIEAARHVRTTPNVLLEEFPDLASTVMQ